MDGRTPVLARAFHLVALVHHGDFLAEIVGFIRVRAGLDGLGLRNFRVT